MQIIEQAIATDLFSQNPKQIFARSHLVTVLNYRNLFQA